MDLNDNNIGDEGAEALKKVLQLNHTDSFIADNQILGCGEWVCSSHRHPIGDQGARAITHAFRYNSSPTLQGICVNTLSDSSFAALGEALKS